MVEPLFEDLVMARHYQIFEQRLYHSENLFLMDDSTRTFWESSMRWLIQYGENLDLAESLILLEWAEEKFLREEHFSWKGRRAEATLLTATEEHSFRHMGHAYYYDWDAKGWDWTCGHPRLGGCEFRELTSGKSLFIEGMEQRHCVARSAYCANSGELAIFSLKTSSGARLTMSIWVASQTIMQAKGKYNRIPTPDEIEAVTAWKNHIKSTQR